jgi:hypothetical protein
MAVLTFRDRPVESMTGLATLAVGLVFWRIGVRARRK